MQGGVVELARQAAAAARAERAERGWATTLPARRYRGVERRGDAFVAEIVDAAALRTVCLGSFETPEEAAYAYDAAARIMHGDRAIPNFSELPAPPAGAGAHAARRGAVAPAPLPLLGHARARTPLAPVGGAGAQRQAFSAGVQQAPAAAAPHSGAPGRAGAAPAFSQFLFHPDAAAAGPAFGAGGGNGGAAFYGLAAMIGGIGGPEPELPVLNYAANTELSSTDKKGKAVVDADSAAADPNPNQNLVIIIDSDSDGEREPEIEDNFHYFIDADGGASTSSAAPPVAVPPLRIKDLMEAEVVCRSADESGEGAP